MQSFFKKKGLIKDLEYWGIAPRKTLNHKEINIDENLIPYYLKGFFDGDGCATITKKGLKITFCGLIPIMNSFFKIVKLFGSYIYYYDKGKGLPYAHIDLWKTSGIRDFYNFCKGWEQPRLDRKWLLIENYFKNKNKPLLNDIRENKELE